MESRSLVEYRARPHTAPVDFGETTVAQLVASYENYRTGLEVAAKVSAVPEENALRFYLLNAAAAHVSQMVDKEQPLSTPQEWILDKYYESMEDIGLRCFFYTFLICTREARHAGLSKCEAELKPEFGSIKFFKSIPDDPNSILEHLKASPPQYTLKKFTELLVQVFEKAGFGGGYGGPAWAAVARPLRDYVNGTTTLEMFLDTVWTLAHNNGPIFNKGMLFNHYTAKELLKILDVQRAGMIPNLIWNGGIPQFTTPHHKALIEGVRLVIPDFGEAGVDWQKVQELGAKGHYHGEMAKKGSPTQPPKPKLPLDPSLLEIMPKVYVKKVKRSEIKA